MALLVFFAVFGCGAEEEKVIGSENSKSVLLVTLNCFVMTDSISGKPSSKAGWSDVAPLLGLAREAEVSFNLRLLDELDTAKLKSPVDSKSSE